jgi:hypothetical protein
MLKKALTVGATVIVAILASGGVAQASVEVAPATLFAAPAQPADPEAPAPDDDSESTSDTTTDSESVSTNDTESDSTTDTESDSTTEPESETSPEDETEQVEPAPAPVAPAPAPGPLGMFESLLSSLFG